MSNKLTILTLVTMLAGGAMGCKSNTSASDTKGTLSNEPIQGGVASKGVAGENDHGSDFKTTQPGQVSGIEEDDGSKTSLNKTDGKSSLKSLSERVAGTGSAGSAESNTKLGKAEQVKSGQLLAKQAGSKGPTPATTSSGAEKTTVKSGATVPKATQNVPTPAMGGLGIDDD